MRKCLIILLFPLFTQAQVSVSFIVSPGAYGYSQSCGDSITDSRNSKKYATVQIGTQCWMKNNINIGTMTTTSNPQTDNSTIEKYCYNNSESNCNTYGGLYTWNEAMQYETIEGSQGICPSGWHIPTEDEYTTLFNQYGDYSTAGTPLKSTSGWSSGCNGTNTSGFTGLPGGVIDRTYSFFITSQGYFNTSTELNSTNGTSIRLNNSTPYINTDNFDKNDYALSIRCIKD